MACTEAVKKASKRWRDRHPEQARANEKKWRQNNPLKIRDKQLQRDYGITLAEFAVMEHRQNGLCAICKGPPDRKYLLVDHDHVTKKVRGLLCHNCNVLLGHAKDSVEILQAATEYLL